MTEKTVKQHLEDLTQQAIEMRVNNNLQTLVSARSAGDHLKLSVNRIFLDAPPSVLEAVADLACGRRLQSARRRIRDFARTAPMPRGDTPVLRRLDTKGKVYDLGQIFSEVVSEYFNGDLDAKITWYGRHLRRLPREMVFGECLIEERVVRISRRLDWRFFPYEYVAYIVYHELCHLALPPKRGRKRWQVHPPEFYELEQKFRYYSFVKDWERKVGLAS